MSILWATLAAMMSMVAWVVTTCVVMLVAVYLARLVPFAGRRRSKTEQPK
jgi:hypothetical protein